MTATRTSTASAERTAIRPRVGVLGIMQELYDDMLPGITERQAAYAQEIGTTLAAGVDVQVAPPARNRADIEATVRGFEQDGLDGVLVVMLTYGPGMRVARALSETRLPVCLANIQPVGEVTTAWDMADLTYNQGIHGAQDTANAMVRAGHPFHVVTGDWTSPEFQGAVR
jgi:L-arabinose isomerase